MPGGQGPYPYFMRRYKVLRFRSPYLLIILGSCTCRDLHRGLRRRIWPFLALGLYKDAIPGEARCQRRPSPTSLVGVTPQGSPRVYLNDDTVGDRARSSLAGCTSNQCCRAILPVATFSTAPVPASLALPRRHRRPARPRPAPALLPRPRRGGRGLAAPWALALIAGVAGFVWWRVEPLIATTGPIAYAAWLLAVAERCCCRVSPAGP